MTILGPSASAASADEVGGTQADVALSLYPACVDTAAKCGPYGNAWVSVGPVRVLFVRACVTSNTANILC